MKALLAIAFVLVLCVALVALIRGIASSTRKTCLILRQRGYSQSQSMLMPTFVCMLFFVAPCTAGDYWPALRGGEYAAFVLMSMSAGALLMVLLRRMPRIDSLRPTGWNRPVRLPFLTLAVACGFLALLVPLKLFLDGSVDVPLSDRLSDVSTVFLSLAGVALLLHSFHRRSRLASVASVLQADPRPPVLYLRAFAVEDTAFAIVKGKDGRRLKSSLLDKLEFGRPYRIRFEEFFGGCISQSVGPFVALGRPGEFLPRFGASREYQANADWEERIARIAQSAQAIVVQCGESENLGWEFRMLLEKGLSERLFVMTSPASARAPKKRIFGRNRNFDLAKAADTAWQSFSACVTRAGYRVSSRPPPGSVLVFDRTGTGHVLLSDATRPEDYVRAMHEQLSELARPADLPKAAHAR